MKKWAEGDFKKDPQLNLIPSMYNKLKLEGHDFTDLEATPKREVQLSKDPNVVSSQQEEDDIAKAIELSLKEKTTSPKAQTASYSSSLYPSVNLSTAPASAGAAASSASAPVPEPRKVRALYDFEAAEDNELTFKAGEIIMVTEESDANWWRGTNHRGEGFFPANFVTADLSAEPEDLTTEAKSSKKVVQFNDESHNVQSQPVEINEDSIDRLLFLLHEADPSDPSQDSEEMLRLENVVNQMGPLIDSELERVDRKHAQLTQLSSDLIDTINLYHSLMRETERAPAMGLYSGFPPGHPQQQMFAGMAYPPNNGNNYRMPGMMMSMPGQGMAFPPTSSNFQLPPQSAPGSFQPAAQNQMMPPVSQQQMMPGMNHHQPMTNGLPQQPGNLQQMGMMPAQMMPGQQQQQQQIQAPGEKISFQIHSRILNNSFSGPNYPSQHHQHHPTQPSAQQNGIPQPNYQMNPNQPMPHPNMQPQMNQMMGNLSLQSPPSSMHNLQQMGQQQGPGMQITQPMTFNLQSDSNQNIPVYQQQR